MRSKLSTNFNNGDEIGKQIDLGTKIVTITNINIPTITSSSSYRRSSKKFIDGNRRKKMVTLHLEIHAKVNFAIFFRVI